MYDIKPYCGAGPINFGMTEVGVTSIFGKPRLRRKIRSGEIDLCYADLFVRLSVKDETVSEIFFPPVSRVFLGEVDIFGDPSAFDKLTKLDGDPFEKVGIVVLFKLGVAITGLHDGDEEQKAISAFIYGRWDESRLNLQPYKRRLQ